MRLGEDIERSERASRRRRGKCDIYTGQFMEEDR